MSLIIPSQYLFAAARELGVGFRILDVEDSERLQNVVVEKYTSRSGGFLWEHLDQALSHYDPNGWRLIDNYIEGRSFLVMFDRREDSTVVEFNHGTRLTSLLENCPGFEFYVTDHKASYIICFNHHDCLIGAGDAVKWSVINQE